MIEETFEKEIKNVKEYITPLKLREFILNRVGECKDKIIFDCSIGSGQLLYNIEAKYKIGIDIQDKKDVCLKNGINEFIQADYITYNDADLNYDYVISNYPFSLKATEEQETYLKKFWNKKKINKTLDEHFILKSFRKAEKGFYLCFPGILYRSSEKEFRKYLIDNNYLKTCYLLDNCNFSQTTINILYLELDKNKTDDKIDFGIYDFKDNNNNYFYSKTNKEIIDNNYNLSVRHKEEHNKEIDINKLNNEYRELIIKNCSDNIKLQLEVEKMFNIDNYNNLKTYFKNKLQQLMLEIDFY